MKVKNCLICQESKFNNIKIENNFEIVRCLNCGLVFLKNPPSREQLDLYYQSFFKEQNDKLWQKFNEKIFRLAKQRIVKEKSKGKILDIGCGYGLFLKMMKEVGFDVCGVEIAKKPAEFAKKASLKIIKEDFNTINFSEKFDVVTLWWVLEHLVDPKKTLIKIKKNLKKRGILILRVPNIDFILFLNKFSFFEPILHHLINPVSGKKYFFEILGAPYHLYGYNQECLSLLLKQIGFTQVKIFLEGEIKTGKRIRDFLEKILYNLSRLMMFLTNNKLIFYHDFMIEAKIK